MLPRLCSACCSAHLLSPQVQQPLADGPRHIPAAVAQGKESSHDAQAHMVTASVKECREGR